MESTMKHSRWIMVGAVVSLLSSTGATGEIMSPALQKAFHEVPIIETVGAVDRDRGACPLPFPNAYVFAWEKLPYRIDLRQTPNGHMAVAIDFNSINWKRAKERKMLEQLVLELEAISAKQQETVFDAQDKVRAAHQETMKTGLGVHLINAQGNVANAQRDLLATMELVSALKMRVVHLM